MARRVRILEVDVECTPMAKLGYGRRWTVGLMDTREEGGRKSDEVEEMGVVVNQTARIQTRSIGLGDSSLCLK